MKVVAFIFLVYPVSFLAEKVRYDNFKVYRVIPEDQLAIETLRTLEDTLEGFNFWQEPTKEGNAVDMMVPPSLEHEFQNILSKHNFSSTILINNVQDLINNERPKTRLSNRMGWEDYRTLDEVSA